MRTWMKAALGAGGAAAVVAAAWAGYREADRRHLFGAPARERGAILFFITDNVRADHTSLCGYARATTPTLEALAAQPGARSTCRAYAPGSWTLPSHASFFTGRTVPEHRAHEYDGTVDDPRGTEILTRPLDAGETTLADELGARGYQTVLLAANPVVGKSTGLAQGYQHVRVAKKMGRMETPVLVEELEAILRDKLDPDGGPLFLTVNLAEAHRPWGEIPPGHPWLPARPRLQFNNEKFDTPWRQLLEKRMADEDKAEFLAHITDVYDYGIQRADAGVAEVLRTVREAGWAGDDVRVVVTSDHGEFIGEHDLVDHGFYVWEENANVYVVASGPDLPALPEPFPALALHDLVLDGRLPDPLPLPETWAWPHVRRAIHSQFMAFNSVSVARWTGWTKQLWMDGTFYRFDLQADPGETGPPGGEPDADFVPLKAVLESQRTREGAQDAEVREALEAAGYLE